jgi:hypothetical protein
MVVVVVLAIIFGPKFNNEKKHMLSKESGKKTPHMPKINYAK